MTVEKQPPVAPHEGKEPDLKTKFPDLEILQQKLGARVEAEGDRATVEYQLEGIPSILEVTLVDQKDHLNYALLAEDGPYYKIESFQIGPVDLTQDPEFIPNDAAVIIQSQPEKLKALIRTLPNPESDEYLEAKFNYDEPATAVEPSARNEKIAAWRERRGYPVSNIRKSVIVPLPITWEGVQTAMHEIGHLTVDQNAEFELFIRRAETAELLTLKCNLKGISYGEAENDPERYGLEKEVSDFRKARKEANTFAERHSEAYAVSRTISIIKQCNIGDDEYMTLQRRLKRDLSLFKRGKERDFLQQDIYRRETEHERAKQNIPDKLLDRIFKETE